MYSLPQSRTSGLPPHSPSPLRQVTNTHSDEPKKGKDANQSSAADTQARSKVSDRSSQVRMLRVQGNDSKLESIDENEPLPARSQISQSYSTIRELRAALADKEAELAAVKAEKAEVEAERDDVQHGLDRYMNEDLYVISTPGQIKDLRAREFEAQVRAKTNGQKADGLVVERDQLQGEKAGLQEHIAALEAELAELVARGQAQQSAHADEKGQLESALETERQSHTVFREDSDRQISGMRADLAVVADLQDTVPTLRKRLETSENKNRIFQAHISAHQREAKAGTEYIDSLRSANHTLQSKIQVAEDEKKSNIAQHAGRIAQLKKEIAGLQAKLDVAEKKGQAGDDIALAVNQLHKLAFFEAEQNDVRDAALLALMSRAGNRHFNEKTIQAQVSKIMYERYEARVYEDMAQGRCNIPFTKAAVDAEVHARVRHFQDEKAELYAIKSLLRQKKLAPFSKEQIDAEKLRQAQEESIKKNRGPLPAAGFPLPASAAAAEFAPPPAQTERRPHDWAFTAPHVQQYASEKHAKIAELATQRAIQLFGTAYTKDQYDSMVLQVTKAWRNR